jgi:hypothetical protein
LDFPERLSDPDAESLRSLLKGESKHELEEGPNVNLVDSIIGIIEGEICDQGWSCDYDEREIGVVF